ncbi:hypothetical protein BGX28_001856, partial [Mortierella sp. GBA30]
KAQNNVIDEEGALILQEILVILGSANNFTKQVSIDRAPIISIVYPTIRDLINKQQTPTTNPTVEEFRNKFVNELERRWDSQNIPDAVLIATFLNPAYTSHAFFDDMVQRHEENVNLREYAKRQILKVLQSMVLGGFTFNDPTAMGKPRDGSNTQFWTTKFSDEIERYDIDVREVSCDLYPTEPHIWWSHRANAFPYLSSVARVYLSVQASSVSSERLFSSAGGILTPKRANLSDYLFC